MMIPDFPSFAPLDTTDREALEAYLRQHPPLASEYTFTNLFAWQETAHYQAARFGEGFLIRKGTEGAFSMLQPLVPADGAGALAACVDYLRAHASAPVFERVGEDFLAQFPPDPARYTMVEERDHFDYVYSVQELIDLAGDKFHDKKNLLNQFQRKYAAEYVPVTAEMAADCLAFAHEWCVERRCEQSEGLAQEQCAVSRILAHFNELSVTGGALFVKGKMAAFTLGEPLCPDTYVIHVEKAKGRVPGIYQAINREFLAHAVRYFPFVNREQDLGEPGLRQAKLSYNPVRMVTKYRIVSR